VLVSVLIWLVGLAWIILSIPSVSRFGRAWLDPQTSLTSIDMGLPERQRALDEPQTASSRGIERKRHQGDDSVCKGRSSGEST